MGFYLHSALPQHGRSALMQHLTSDDDDDDDDDDNDDDDDDDVRNNLDKPQGGRSVWPRSLDERQM